MTTLEKGLADLKSIQDGSAHAIGRAAGVTNLVRDTVSKPTWKLRIYMAKAASEW